MAVAPTTSGWRGVQRSSTMCCPCSSMDSAPASTATPPTGCTRCSSGTPHTSSASAGAVPPLPMGEAFAACLDELAARYGLSERARDGLAHLLHALISDPHAPTSVREAQAGLREHLADAL